MTVEAITFGPFKLDMTSRTLSCDGSPVRIGGRACDILCALAAANGEVVTKDALMAAVWPGQIVEENAIQVQISGLRKALDQAGQDHIVTVPGRGYRLVGIAPPASCAAQQDGTANGAGGRGGRSIAVLPFQNMSSDPEQDYFADGMVEDIIAGLARISWLSVIARNSSFAYRGRSVDVKLIARDLDVRYVLEGSVRKTGDRVRITVQLIDAQTGVHLWVERYDRRLDDVFALQDEIAMNVVGAIEPNLRKAELERIKRKRPDSLDAYDYVLQAMPHAYSHMPEKAAIAIPLLKKALEIEPDYAAAHAPLALCYHARYARLGLREEDRIAAVRHAQAAMAGGSDDAIALGIAGFVIAIDGQDRATGLELLERALTLSNSNALSLSCSALALSWMGRTELAIERAERALRLSPFDPLNYLAYNALAISHYHVKRYQEAAAAARRSVQSNPQFGMSHAFLAAALHRLNRDDDASAAARQAIACDPNFSIGRFSITAGFEPAVYTPFAEAWRVVGIPE